MAKKATSVAKSKPAGNKSGAGSSRLSAAKEFAPESSYLKGSDVTEPFDAKISGLEKVEFDDGRKWVLRLTGHKSVVVNKTNGASLASDLGDDMDAWVGRSITISTERRRNPRTNEFVNAICVCGAESEDESTEETDQSPDDGDFDDDELE
jgi:hypothetical protein